MKDYCGNSSVGRASRCQRECREFESRFPLQIYTLYRGDLRIRSGAGIVVVRQPRVQSRGFHFISGIALAGWQSGDAAACKAVYAGSIPTPASIFCSTTGPGWWNW